MSEAAIEALESEAYEASEGESEAAEALESEAAEAAGLGEAYSDEARRRRQRIMMARLAQRRPTPPAPALQRPGITAQSQALRGVRSELQSLDFDTKVALDSLRSRLNKANRRDYRNAWAAEASAAASQILDSFEINLEPHDWARALIRGAPTLLLDPGPRKPGLEGVLYDPRFAGGALLAGIFLIGHFRSASKGVDDIVIDPVPAGQLAAGQHGKFTGTVVDKNGNPVAGVTITWSSQNPNFLAVDPDGTFRALLAGPTRVIATGGGFTKRQDVTVT